MEDLQAEPSVGDCAQAASYYAPPQHSAQGAMQARHYSSSASRSKLETRDQQVHVPPLLWSNVKYTDAINHDPILAVLKLTLKKYYPESDNSSNQGTPKWSARPQTRNLYPEKQMHKHKRHDKTSSASAHIDRNLTI